MRNAHIIYLETSGEPLIPQNVDDKLFAKQVEVVADGSPCILLLLDEVETRRENYL